MIGGHDNKITMPEKLKDIKPNLKNPRLIKKERMDKLQEYMQEFGDLSGLVVNADGTIISGHQRLRVFKKDKGQIVIYERYEPPTAHGTTARGFIELKDGSRFVYREVDWPQYKADRATIIANGQFGEWDSDLLTNEWDFDIPELKEFGVPEFVFGVTDAMIPPDEDELTAPFKDKAPCMKITFPTVNDIQRCEADIQEVLNRICPDAYYSVSAGEI